MAADKQREENDEKAKKDREQKLKKEAEEKAKKDREEKLKKEAEEKAEKDREEKQKKEIEEKSKKNREAKQREVGSKNMKRTRCSSVEDDHLIIDAPCDFDISPSPRKMKSVVTEVSYGRQHHREIRPEGSFVPAGRLRELLELEERFRKMDK